MADRAGLRRRAEWIVANTPRPDRGQVRMLMPVVEVLALLDALDEADAGADVDAYWRRMRDARAELARLSGEAS